MEIVLLVLAAILICKYIKQRSPAVTAAHIVFFVVIAYLTLFSSNIPFIAKFAQNAFGIADYLFIRKAMLEPCIWIYSTNLALYILELLLFLLVQVGTVAEVVKYLERTGAKNYRRKTKPQFDWACVPARITYAEEKLYLDKCSLLI